MVGIVGFTIKANENLVLLIISLELILLGIALLFAYTGFIQDDLVGPMVSLLILPLAGAESALALVLLVAYYPYRGSLNI